MAVHGEGLVEERKHAETRLSTNVGMSRMGNSSMRVCRPGGSIATSSMLGSRCCGHGRKVAAPPPANGKQNRRVVALAFGWGKMSQPLPATRRRPVAVDRAVVVRGRVREEFRDEVGDAGSLEQQRGRDRDMEGLPQAVRQADGEQGVETEFVERLSYGYRVSMPRTRSRAIARRRPDAPACRASLARRSEPGRPVPTLETEGGCRETGPESRSSRVSQTAIWGGSLRGSAGGRRGRGRLKGASCRVASRAPRPPPPPLREPRVVPRPPVEDRGGQAGGAPGMPRAHPGSRSRRYRRTARGHPRGSGPTRRGRRSRGRAPGSPGSTRQAPATFGASTRSNRSQVTLARTASSKTAAA